MKEIATFLLRKASTLHDVRNAEYNHTRRFIGEVPREARILDIACGTGTFLEMYPENAEGVDINPENVAYCVNKGLTAREGNALSLPYDSDCFDVVHCSHLMQVFSNWDAQKFVRECTRVCKNKGILVVSTLNSFSHFWQHAENARPYPPDVWEVYTATQDNSSSPMWNDMPCSMTKKNIAFRHPALFSPRSYRSRHVNYCCTALINIQLYLGIKAYWRFNAYTICLLVEKHGI